ncbi:MAG: ribosomal-processing cysteine protease Prp [Lachnospiraceae bacterium]|nr:ribosomal-processing cysteine protease Prp [Lachnospiraceae bacterium]
MTTIRIYKDSTGEYKGFQCRDHAGSGDYGFDIVCAAISVLTINTVNSLEKLTKDTFDLTQQEELGLIQVIFHNHPSEAGRVLMDSYVMGIESIEEEYGSQYIKVIHKEV